MSTIKKAEEMLEASLADALAEALDKIDRLATAHLDNPTGVSGEFTSVVVVLRQIACNALREYREAKQLRRYTGVVRPEGAPRAARESY